MRQWEILYFPFPSQAEPHPFVILSVDEIALNPQYLEVNALKCVSVRGAYRLKPNDVWLDQSEGLGGPTVVRCHVMFLLRKGRLPRNRGGAVSVVRRREIARKVNACFKLSGI
jgi:hypothetical protein